MKRHKVLVVDDSAFMRKLISDIVNSDPAFEVVATARNGRDALEKLRHLEVDAMTLDVEMPEMNGLEALQHVMTEHPLPIIMISSLTYQGAKETIYALEQGAFDFVAKPSGSISLDLYKVKDELLTKLKSAVEAEPQFETRRNDAPHSGRSAASRSPDAAKRSPASFRPRRRDPSARPTTADNTMQFEQIVAIGTSTGGPRALQRVLADLPPSFPAPVVIVQHMPPGFTRSLAQRLNMLSEITVVEAEDGIPLQSGVAYIAPGGRHMEVVRRANGSYRIALNEEEPVGGHRPSVERLFASLRSLTELRQHIVLMTGMGADGAQAMKQLRDQGATTIAEAEETCIVYGMPRNAVQIGAAQYILPLYRIGSRLVQLADSAR